MGTAQAGDVATGRDRCRGFMDGRGRGGEGALRGPRATSSPVRVPRRPAHAALATSG